MAVMMYATLTLARHFHLVSKRWTIAIAFLTSGQVRKLVGYCVEACKMKKIDVRQAYLYDGTHDLCLRTGIHFSPPECVCRLRSINRLTHLSRCVQKQDTHAINFEHRLYLKYTISALWRNNYERNTMST